MMTKTPTLFHLLLSLPALVILITWSANQTKAFSVERIFSPRFFGISSSRRILPLSAEKSSSSSSSRTKTKEQTIEIGDLVGSGSYGTVHWIHKGGQKYYIGKRAWTAQDDLPETNSYDNNNNILNTANNKKEKLQRCATYWKTERHCLKKLTNAAAAKNEDGASVSTNNIAITPRYQGTATDAQGREWILLEVVTAEGQDDGNDCTIPPANIAPTLQDVMEQDRKDHKTNEEHHLYCLSQALGLNGATTTLTETLDVIISQLLLLLSVCHQHDIVHRDVKPGNLLVTQDGRLRLIDFGSAADLSSSEKMWRLPSLQTTDIVSVSPIYAAPELFVDESIVQKAVKFDCFSAGLLICQLLLQYLDERTESGFHQQLAAVDNDLDAWLLQALQGKVQPSGLTDALQVLGERPGLWKLLKGLLQTDPDDRISSAKALRNWNKILQPPEDVDTTKDPIFDDGAYLQEVVELSELCAIPPTIWPLHYVATFDRKKSLGLYLAEANADPPEDPVAAAQWAQATKEALPGEVFVQGVVPGGQADDMGIFQVGDRLEGVGELPTAAGGFENVLELLQDQPRSSKFVTLHFDRRSVLNDEASDLTIYEGPIQVSDRGAWSSRGRRSTQEDAFVLHEVHDTKQRSILLAGVMDGHLGRAASNFVKEELPAVFSEELLLASSNVPTEDLLGHAWDRVCNTYQNKCISGEECVADYNPREGLLMANTGSEDSIAGTTTVVMALDKQTSHLVFLNCGDSRGLVTDSKAKVLYKTKDHTPEREAERLISGQKQGLLYKEPQCRMNRWTIEVGDYTYAVARSLEGPYATERGIVAMPDIDVLQAEPGTTAVLASDGLWEVMDSEQVARILAKLRWEESTSAGDAAKTLCSMAVERGSSDNVSAVVVYIASD